MPIYNPATAASSVDNGEAYFQGIGLLTPDMLPLFEFNDSIAAPDLTVNPAGNAITITNNVGVCTGGSGTHDFRQAGWQFSAAKTKLLAVGFFHRDTILGFSPQTTWTGFVDDGYYAYTPGDTGVAIRRALASAYSLLAEDTSVSFQQANYAQAYGLALYQDSGTDIQKVFVRPGSTTQWIPLGSTADSSAALADMNMVFVGSTGGPGSVTSRFITPLYVWGV